MLEVRAKWAHLMCRTTWFEAPANTRDFVRDLFTISDIAAFDEIR